MRRKLEIKSGDRYGKLTIIKESQSIRTKSGSLQRMVECSCDCGNVKIVNLYHLLKNNINSCGCLYKTISSKNSLKHHMYSTPEYFTWKSMKARCTNPKSTGYKNYGERGIIICERWVKSFNNFYEDMGKRPLGYTLDRIDPNGNYEPTNCRWATIKEQSINKRKK